MERAVYREFTEIAEEQGGGDTRLRKEPKGWEEEPVPQGGSVDVRVAEELRGFPELAEEAPTVSGEGRGSPSGYVEAQTWRRKVVLTVS